MRIEAPLFYDPKQGKYYDYILGVEYVRFGSEVEFEQYREEYLKSQAVEKEKELEKVWPIYYNTKTNCYYYPKMALIEEPLQVRKVVNRKNPIPFDIEKSSFVAPGSKISYILLRSQSEFLRRRDELQDNGEKLEGVVYFDKKYNVYYYPNVALDPMVEMVLKQEDTKKPPIK